MNVLATINGHAAIELRVELRRDGEPSTARGVLPPGARIDAGAALEIEIGDARTRRTFRQFTCRRVVELGDGRTRVHASDRRRDWDVPARIELNVPLGDGTGWRDGEPVAPQQAMARLFDSAGIPSPIPQLLPTSREVVAFRTRGSLASGVSRLMNEIGQTLTVDDEGAIHVASADDEPGIDASTVVETSASVTTARARVTGGPPVKLVKVTDWECVLPDEHGDVRPLPEVLAEWGVDESRARRACLNDGGFEALLPKTSPGAGTRLAILKRHAYRMFRALDDTAPWLPVGGVADSGELAPPRLSATFTRALGNAPGHPREPHFETVKSEPVEPFELDPERRLLYVPHPPHRSEGADDPTVQSRHLVGGPLIELTVGVPASLPPVRVESGDGDETLHVDAPHLIAVYEDGRWLNHDRVRTAALELARSHAARRVRTTTLVSGAGAQQAVGTAESVVITCGPGGLTTTIRQAPPAVAAPAVIAPHAPKFQNSGEPRPSGLHQPINAYRGGPLVVRTSGQTPEAEGVLAMEATHRDSDTGALELRHPGALAFPFHLPSEDAARFGRWFFVAGVEVADTGRLRVLAPDERHVELPVSELFKARHVPPRGLRGLAVSLGDEARFVDTGPLVADSRGRHPGNASSLVYDLDGSTISARRHGGLQFLSVLALSPAHRREGTRDRGWVPVLNFREGDTTSPEVLGRGLFAEGHGRDLGRLTAKQQGGPILADAGTCLKHLYGTVADDDGVYRESSGHISTEAFFKVPGDPVHDAPLKFYAEPFAGRVPSWRPFEAQVKYDAGDQHPWNRALREGRWKIQYRVPFFPEIPPTWKPPIEPPVDDPPTEDPPAINNPAMQTVPHEIRPVVTEHEIWAPSHDWIPAPSKRDVEREIPMRGPSVTSEGWAGEEDGVPDPSLGGGCIYLPPGVPLPEALTDNGERRTYLALHPQVVLAFGFPGFSGDARGHVHTGWAVQLADGGDLELLPRDADASTEGGLARGVHVTGHMRVGPDGAAFGESQALRLGAGSGEGIAFGEDANLYRNAGESLRTDGSLEIGGKLTVDGLIDPTGLELEPQSSNPGNVAANTLWLNDADGNLYLGDKRVALIEETN